MLGDAQEGYVSEATTGRDRVGYIARDVTLFTRVLETLYLKVYLNRVLIAGTLSFWKLVKAQSEVWNKRQHCLLFTLSFHEENLTEC